MLKCESSAKGRVPRTIQKPETGRGRPIFRGDVRGGREGVRQEASKTRRYHRCRAERIRRVRLRLPLGVQRRRLHWLGADIARCKEAATKDRRIVSRRW